MLTKEYIPVESNAPFKGLATSPPSTRISPDYSPQLMNVVVRDGVVSRRSGYLQLGQQLDGVVLGITEFGPLGAVPLLVVFTSKRQYRFNVAANLFVDITKRKHTVYAITGIDQPNKEFEVATNVTAQFFAGRRFTVSGSAANNGIYTVVSSSFAAVTIIVVSQSISSTTIDGNIEATTIYPITAVDAVGPIYSFTVATDVTAIFTVGLTFFVEGSTGNNATYTVSSRTFAAGFTTIITIEVIPNAVADGRIELADTLSTSETDFIDFVDVTDSASGKRLIMTNGIDAPRVWTGGITAVDQFLKWPVLFTSFVTCRTLQVFTEHLFMGGITAGTSEPQLIAWSDSGDFDDFENGAAGIQLLHQLVGGIKALEPLGDRLVVYSPDAIANGIFVGLPAVFAFETIIPLGTRLISQGSIVSINIGHVYASQENFYSFDGTRGLRVVSSLIYTDYKAVKDNDKLYRVAALNDYSKRTIYLALPDLEGRTTIYTVEYDVFNLDSLVWAKERYADNVRAFGFYTNTVVVTWADTAQEAVLFPAGMPWSEEIGVWGNEGEQVDFPVRTFGNDVGKVYLASESILTDNGTTEPGFYETADFTIPQAFHSQLGRWGEIEFEARGGTCTVSISLDLGATFVAVQTLDLGGSYVSNRLPIDFTSRTIRVRFDFSGAFSLRWIRLWVRPVAPR